LENSPNKGAPPSDPFLPMDKGLVPRPQPVAGDSQPPGICLSPSHQPYSIL